jgi:peptidoglycan/LPS O-acetylase OafA/YrhL
VLHYRLRLPLRSDRRVAVDALLIIATVALVAIASARGELAFRTDRYEFVSQLALCATFALLLIALRRFDDRFARSAAGRVLRGAGAFSYSLYLVHFPLLELLEPFRKSAAPVLGEGGATLTVVAGVLACAWGFYRVFEKPFLTKNPEASFDAAR